MRRPSPEIGLLLFYLDQAFGRRGWHGPTLTAALRGVSVSQALWRPAPGRNSIWELVLHAAFWKHEVRRRLSGGKGERFPRTPVNFPSVPEWPTTGQWRDDVALLKSEHARLVALVGTFPAAKLHRKIAGTRYVPVEQIAGIAAHDLYHCGQIVMLKKLQGVSGKR